MRGGINFRLDLSEGVDLSIFLFGNFQKYIFGKGLFELKPDFTVFDVGANIGLMTLQYAKTPECAHVWAFEPTDFAFEKLMKNLELNPDLKNKITPTKTFIAEKSTENSDLKAYASWKLVKNQNEEAVHPLHLGSVSEAKNTPSISLDEFVEIQKIERLDLIKIDTDGHELTVLKGAVKTIEKFKPFIVFEAGLYIFEENNLKFTYIFDVLKEFDCRLIDLKTKKQVTEKNYGEIIPHKSTTDIVIIFD